MKSRTIASGVTCSMTSSARCTCSATRTRYPDFSRIVFNSCRFVGSSSTTSTVRLVVSTWDSTIPLMADLSLHRLHVPDFVRVLADRAVARELSHPGDVEDDFPRPLAPILEFLRRA